MAKKRKALGKDLSALLEDINIEKIEDKSLIELSLNEIHPNPYQPRNDFKNDSLKELASSIQTQGVLQPIVVRPKQETVSEYELIAGERRWRAAKMAGLSHMPAVVREVDDKSLAILALVENVQRDDLNAYEQAEAFEALRTRYSYTQKQLADLVGMSRAAVANIIRLLKLEDPVGEMVKSGRLELGHAKVLLALEDKEQIRAAEEVINRRLTVLQTEKLVNRFHKRPRKRRQMDVNILSLQEDISDKLGVQVKFQYTHSGKGKMIVHYNSLDELDGVLKTLGLSSPDKIK